MVQNQKATIAPGRSFQFIQRHPVGEHQKERQPWWHPVTRGARERFCGRQWATKAVYTLMFSLLSVVVLAARDHRRLEYVLAYCCDAQPLSS